MLAHLQHRQPGMLCAGSYSVIFRRLLVGKPESFNRLLLLLHCEYVLLLNFA